MALYNDYIAVVEGENRFGWRLAIPTAIPDEYRPYCISWWQGKIIHDRNGMPSIVVAFPVRTGHTIRQYSLVSPNISSTIAHLRRDINWSFIYCLCLMGLDHLAVVFRSYEILDRYRFKVFNISTSSLARIFDIVLPCNGYPLPLVHFYTIDGHQPILVASCNNISATWTVSDYEVPRTDEGSVVPLVRQKSSKPDPYNRYRYSLTVHRKDALQSLNRLCPIPCATGTLSCELSICQHPLDSAIYVYSSSHGLLRRWSKVPSLKIQAAEALFRARPTLDRWKLKKQVGFDIFDGMPKRDPLASRVAASLRKACYGCSIL